MLTTGNILIPQMRNPVASRNKPPTALKSAIIAGVASGNISAAAHASGNWMISNGTVSYTHLDVYKRQIIRGLH